MGFGLGGKVIVATDHRRVVRAVEPLGVEGVLTSSSHRSGTERIAEVLLKPQFARAEIVLNLQGDQPFLPCEAAVGALDWVRRGLPVGTAAAPLSAGAETDPSRVKVAVDDMGRARFFRRQPIVLSTLSQRVEVFHHLGVYAYTRKAVLEWTGFPETACEHAEGLEQLRPLEYNMPIGVTVLDRPAPAGIDTPADLCKARAVHAEELTKVSS